MKYIFYLEHNHEEIAENGEVSDNAKLLGLYSTKEKAELAIDNFITLPGYKDYPNDFHIDRYELNENCYVEGFKLSEGIYSVKGYVGRDDDNCQDANEKIVFMLQHGYKYINSDDNECEETRILGIYSTWEKGLLAKQYYKTLPGFKDLPDNCFYLGDYVLNEPTIWGNGFVIAEEDKK